MYKVCTKFRRIGKIITNKKTKKVPMTIHIRSIPRLLYTSIAVGVPDSRSRIALYSNLVHHKRCVASETIVDGMPPCIHDTFISIYLYIYLFTEIYIYIRIYIYIQTTDHTMYMYIYISVYTCICIHIIPVHVHQLNAYIYIYIYIYEIT